jgi:myo-inositol-1(or 4)-monophosphatase
MDLKDLCREMVHAAHETGSYIRSESEHFDLANVEHKGLHDFVSYVDKGAEKRLVEKLGLLIPEAGFKVEEGTSSKKGDRYNWIIDPLDGTTNFLHRLHPHSISIGLKDNNEIIAGVVYEVKGDETFVAWKNGGAWVNNNKINVSRSLNISNSLVATGFPYKDFSRLEAYIKCLDHFMRNSSGVRRMGCASIDLAYVACGRFDAFFEYGLNPWDVSAGMLLVREAGGIVSDFSGNEEDVSGAEIIAANSVLFPEFLKITNKFMQDKNHK